MKRGYNTPTISSVNKSSSDPASLRDKIQKLSSAVNELRHNVVQEDTYIETLQQSNIKNQTQLNQQLQILKKVQQKLNIESFTSLSDILLNEITTLSENFGVAVNQLNQKVDYLGTQVQANSQDTEQMNINFQEIEQELQNLLRGNQTRDREQEQFNESITNITIELEREKNDSKLVIEKIKAIIQNSSNQIEVVSKDKNLLAQQVQELKTSSKISLNQQINQEKKINEIEDQNKIAILELQNKLNEIKTQNFQQKDNSRNDTINTMRELTSIVRSIEERMRSFDENIDQSQNYVKHKINDFEQKQNQLSDEFQQDLQELAQIYKESSSQIITDFDKTVKSQHLEIKYLVKKIDLVESKCLQLSEEFQQKKWREK